MKNCATCLSLLTALLLTTGSAGAATLEQTFMNDFETNAIYLWSLDASNMSLDGFSASADMGGWQADSISPAHMVLSGPTVAAGAGRFNLLMNYKSTPFSARVGRSAVRSCRRSGQGLWDFELQWQQLEQ